MSILKNDAEVRVNLHELADYTKPGVTRKALVKNEQNSFSLLCLTAGTKMPEHTALRPISVTIIEGCGVLTLKEQEITLQPGVFVYIPANTPGCTPCPGQSRLSAYLKLNHKRRTRQTLFARYNVQNPAHLILSGNRRSRLVRV